MTREELKEHCLRQVEGCEMWAKCKGEEPHGKVYEEHKLILELLEQEPILDKLRAEIEQDAFKDVNGSKYIFVNRVNQILDKYKGEVRKRNEF